MNDGIWLITSGAYVSQELAAEFGQMPPAFLPVGTKRLYEYQIERIGKLHLIYLTVPETYDVPPEDARRLNDRGVLVLPVPEGLSLGESLVFALNLIGGPDQQIRILHGDTLIDQLPTETKDQIGVAVAGEGYSWAEVAIENDRVISIETVPAGRSSEPLNPIACGYFSFSHSSALVRSITRARGSFIGGIRDYIKENCICPIKMDSWYDFGHVQTFFRSRRIVTAARHFNEVLIDGRTARKSSHDTAKIRAEANWFREVPAPLRIYCARLVDHGTDASGQAFYETEYDHLPTLSELFVFGGLGGPAWGRILSSCREFLLACANSQSAESGDDALHELVIAKTASRLRRFADETGFNINGMLRYDGRPLPSLMQIAEDIAGQINLGAVRPAQVMHGDFCFSNVLYDSRVQRIHVIDPRGYIHPGQATIQGDLRYDLAKLTHSIIGRYDQIIAGRYMLNPTDGNRYCISFEQAPHHVWLEQTLNRFEVDGVVAGGREVRAVCVALFLSMLPLHSDRPDRQRAFVANALRLYADLAELPA